MKKLFLIFSFLTILSCSTVPRNFHVYIDREKDTLYVTRNNETVFKTKTSYWKINGDYITELIASENDIKVYLYDYTKDELSEYPFDSGFDLEAPLISSLHQRFFIDRYFSLLPSSKILFFHFNFTLSPGIYSIDLRKEGSTANLIYRTDEKIDFLDVTEEYLCFRSFFDSLWIKSFKNDSLYGMCLSKSCADPTASGHYPMSLLFIDSNKLLIMMSDGSLYVLNLDNLTKSNLDNLTKSNFNNSMHLVTYRGNSFSDRKLYYYMWEIGAEVDVVEKISFHSFDLDSYEIDSNIFEILKPKDYYSIYVDFYSIDKNDKLHIYIKKIKPSSDKRYEYDEWFDYIIYDLDTRKVVSKKENLEKIERYLVK